MSNAIYRQVSILLNEPYITQEGKVIRAFPLYELKRRMTRRELPDSVLARFNQVRAKRHTITGKKGRWALVVTMK